MHIVHVHFKVKPKHIEEFKSATEKNAENSIREEGVIRFELMQEQDNHDMFLLTEFYQSPADQKKHRETAHFKIWKSTIEDWLQEPYTFTNYQEVFVPVK